MGTLGCINDMMRRDKENRELRKAGKERKGIYIVSRTFIRDRKK